MFFFNSSLTAVGVFKALENVAVETLAIFAT
jgi:hypothetical protein